jgi:FkbM family methyltransferase
MVMKNPRYVADAFYFDTDIVSKNPTFVHVGTFTGKLETKLTEMFPDCKIYSIEPHPDNFARLVKSTSHLENVIRINKAVITTDDEKTKLEGSGSCATTYLTTRGIEVQATTIEKIIKEYEISDVDCMFYNAEGSEMEFIPYIVSNSINKKIKQLCLNFHVHVPQFNITYEKVDNLLRNSGISDLYDINDDRITKIASKATGSPTSEKYPCFLFIRK